MVKLDDVINWAKYLADNKIGHDQDGVWGSQCVDLPNGASSKFFGKALMGNAIDLLNSAKALGYKVELNKVGDVNSRPKRGAFFVQRVAGHNFGHVGLVIEDSDGYTMKTIEQNIDGWSDKNRDGINDQLQFGGIARYNTRNFDGVIGWFYLPYDESTDNFSKLMKLDKVRKATVTVDVLNIRNSPSLNAKVVATYKKGDTFLYSEFIYNEGYCWLSYIGKKSGRRVYVAAETEDLKARFVTWEYFKGA